MTASEEADAQALFEECELRPFPAMGHAHSSLPSEPQEVSIAESDAAPPHDIMKELKGEVILALALPFITGVGTGLSAAAGGPAAAKATSYIFIATSCARALVRDLELTRRLILSKKRPPPSVCVVIQEDLKKLPTSPLTMTKLEVLDAVSDGAAWTTVRLHEANDPLFVPRLIYAYSHSGWLTAQLAVGMQTLGLSGCMMLSLLGALLAQSAAVKIRHREGGQIMLASAQADMAGLGALGEALGDALTEDLRGSKAFGLIVSRVVCESLPQLLWQSSAIMAMDKSLLENPVLLLSLTLTLITTAQKGVDTVKVALQDAKPLLVWGAIILLATLYFATKLAMAQICPSHSWNLAFPPMRGCIEFPF
eukprot:gnl/TRDRNA2_/TRDRNA2_31739_c0_seq1.p1 gnl/TRDRNA2_/TRDRNA2_31739_c0~~gnl/TRDRNA2_/TRDRNA2_31739_c0_seq1.p1  ORF type:complete len:423 (-),score=56.49 gnl/TRDRNA2_/TRDRNA2_31739_c0_seq1:63-1160(-)